MRQIRNLLAAALLAAVAVSAVVRAEGVNDEGFLKNFLVIAPIPFDGAGGDAVDKDFIAGEAKLEPKEGDKAKADGKEYSWKKVAVDDYSLDFNAYLGNQTEDSVAYAVTYITADKEMKDLKLKVGSDDQTKVYLNGKEVYKFTEPRSADKDQGTVENVTLKKGVNVLVAKVVNEKADWSFNARFTDAGDNPVIKGIKSSASK